MEPEEAKILVSKIFQKIDENESGFLERDESVSWIRKVEHDHVNHDSKIVFDDYDKDSDGYLK